MCCRLLELQTGLTGGRRQGGHAAVELVFAAVKHDLLLARLQGPLGDRLAHGRGGRLVAAVSEVLAKNLVAAAGRDSVLPAASSMIWA